MRRPARQGAHQRRGGAHRRRGHRLVADRATRWCAARGAQGDSRRPGARVHDRLQRGRGGRRGGAEAISRRRPAARPTRATPRTSRPSTAASRASSDAHGRQRPYSRSEYNRALIAQRAARPVRDRAARGGRGRRASCSARCVLLLPVGARALRRRGGAHLLRRGRGQQGARARARQAPRRARVGRGRLDPATLAPPIARPAARRAPARGAHPRGDRAGRSCPTTEVLGRGRRASSRAMEGTARAARSCSTRRWPRRPPAWVEQRLAELRRRRPGRRRSWSRRSTDQLDGAAADGGPAAALLRRDGAHAGGAGHRARATWCRCRRPPTPANQQQLAADVRGLREEVGALAEGMSEAYERPSA